MDGISKREDSLFEHVSKLIDEARKHLKTTIDTTMAIQVAYFLDRYLPETRTVTARHILLSVPTTTEESTEEDIAEAEAADAAAKAKIEEILAEFQSGEQTEEAFGELALKYSQDSGSVTDRGLIEEFSEGQMVTEFNDWCFDKSRKEGDVEIVKTNYGYHLIYFVSEGAPFWQVNARNVLLNEQYNEYYSTLTGKYAVSTDDSGRERAY